MVTDEGQQALPFSFDFAEYGSQLLGVTGHEVRVQGPLLVVQRLAPTRRSATPSIVQSHLNLCR